MTKTIEHCFECLLSAVPHLKLAEIFLSMKGIRGVETVWALKLTSGRVDKFSWNVNPKMPYTACRKSNAPAISCSI